MYHQDENTKIQYKNTNVAYLTNKKTFMSALVERDYFFVMIFVPFKRRSLGILPDDILFTMFTDCPVPLARNWPIGQMFVQKNLNAPPPNI